MSLSFVRSIVAASLLTLVATSAFALPRASETCGSCPNSCKGLRRLGITTNICTDRKKDAECCYTLTSYTANGNSCNTSRSNKCSATERADGCEDFRTRLNDNQYYCKSASVSSSSN